jgi:hypothetical protein
MCELFRPENCSYPSAEGGFVQQRFEPTSSTRRNRAFGSVAESRIMSRIVLPTNASAGTFSCIVTAALLTNRKRYPCPTQQMPKQLMRAVASKFIVHFLSRPYDCS